MIPKFTFIILSLVFFTSCFNQQNTNTLHQFSPLQTLINGKYDGLFKYKTIKKNGNFGLGTFNQINGEMVALDGHFYQILSSGAVYEVTDNQTSPFASVHFFNADTSAILSNTTSLESLEKSLLPFLNDPSIMYGIKLSGTFSTLTLRAQKKQTKPYPPLNDVISNQSIFKKQNIVGTLT